MLNKELLAKYVAEYKENFMEIRYGEGREIYKWEAVVHFQNNWNIDALNFVEMLEIALSKTENLLTAAMFFPKGMLIGLAKKEPETVREMFRNLFDESKDLRLRISDFTHSADELHKRNPGGNRHYQEPRAISIYLWLKYPEKYYIYQYEFLKTVVKELEGDHKIKKTRKPDSMMEGYRFFDEIREELKNDIELVKLNFDKGLEGFRDEGLTTLTEDVAFFIRGKLNGAWEPTLKEYNPNITVEKWRELLAVKEVFTEKAVKVVNGILTLGGQATCKQLAESFGDTYNFYNSVSLALAKRVQAATNCAMPPQKEKDTERYWPILYVGRNIKGEEGVFEWKLRDELKEALKELDLPPEKFIGQKGKVMPKYPKNLILYGPPGTGKTYYTVNYAVAIIENKTVDEIEKENREAVLKRFREYKDAGLVAFCTFHQSFGYEEFIEGIKPRVENGNVVYDVKDGAFKKFCKKEETNVPRNRVFIIDEINRGNISKIFGELITLIEDTKRIGADEEMQTRLPYSEEDFGVPSNVYILGTMNTADRSIALIDTALRRRFKFEEMQPKPALLKDVVVDGVNVQALLEMLNKRIEVLYDREHTIGHSFFMGLNDKSTIYDLAEIFEHNVIPLLKEYFYDEYERIAAVLGDDLNQPDEESNFILRQDNDYAKIKNTDIAVMTAYKFNRKALYNPKAYTKIYED